MGKRRLTSEKRAVAVAVVAVEVVLRRCTVTSRTDAEHNVLSLLFLRCREPPRVRDVTGLCRASYNLLGASPINAQCRRLCRVSFHRAKRAGHVHRGR
jgi:hypothetical protein